MLTGSRHERPPPRTTRLVRSLVPNIAERAPQRHDSVCFTSSTTANEAPTHKHTARPAARACVRRRIISCSTINVVVVVVIAHNIRRNVAAAACRPQCAALFSGIKYVNVHANVCRSPLRMQIYTCTAAAASVRTRARLVVSCAMRPSLLMLMPGSETCLFNV